MNPIKRPLNMIESFDNIKKKLAKTIDQTKKSLNYFENFSNDIFYEIFEYLDGCDIFHIFSNLNSRFRYLLLGLSISLKFNLAYATSPSLLFYYEKIIRENKHRIISLSLSQTISLNSILMDVSFHCLQSLTLGINDSEELKPLANLPSLLALTVYLHGSLFCNNDIYIQIFALPYLKYTKVSFEDLSKFHFRLMSTNEKYSSIECLIVDHNCTCETLSTILSYTPRLLRLICTKKLMDSSSSTKQISLNKPRLTHISINECSSKFQDLEILLRQISSQLKVLRISTLNDIAYLNADRWERLICQYLPQLIVLEFKYTEFLDKRFRSGLYHKTIHRFTSPFWIERRWDLQYKIGAGGHKGGIISYIIRPYKYNQNDPFITHYPSNDSIQLTVIHLALLKWPKSFIKSIKPVLSLFQITRLVFTNHGILIRTFLDILRILPNLNSLVISSLVASTDKTSFTPPKNKTLASNVTKVHLGRVTTLEEVQFLIHLCPHMHYLEVDDINKFNFHGLLQMILIEHRKNIFDDFSLHLRHFPFDDQTIQQLEDVINTEKLHENCSFTHTFDNLFLHYKKY